MKEKLLIICDFKNQYQQDVLTLVRLKNHKRSSDLLNSLFLWKMQARYSGDEYDSLLKGKLLTLPHPNLPPSSCTPFFLLCLRSALSMLFACGESVWLSITADLHSSFWGCFSRALDTNCNQQHRHNNAVYFTAQ